MVETLELNYGILFCAAYMYKYFSGRTIFEFRHDWFRHIRIYNLAGFIFNLCYLLIVRRDAELNWSTV